MNSYRYIYTYDAVGRMLSELYEAWTNNQRVSLTHCIYTYDINGNMVTGQSEWWHGGGWAPENRDFNVTDSAGNAYRWVSAHTIMLRYRLVTTRVTRNRDDIPIACELKQNYPNPFNPSTTIRYELPKPSVVRLAVYDMLGREVSVVADERRNAGTHEVTFDASALSSGVYLYRLSAGAFAQTRKLLLLQ